jgi:hypothetical protein
MLRLGKCFTFRQSARGNYVFERYRVAKTTKRRNHKERTAGKKQRGFDK